MGKCTDRYITLNVVIIKRDGLTISFQQFGEQQDAFERAGKRVDDMLHDPFYNMVASDPLFYAWTSSDRQVCSRQTETVGGFCQDVCGLPEVLS